MGPALVSRGGAGEGVSDGRSIQAGPVYSNGLGTERRVEMRERERERERERKREKVRERERERERERDATFNFLIVVYFHLWKVAFLKISTTTLH